MLSFALDRAPPERSVQQEKCRYGKNRLRLGEIDSGEVT